MSLIKAVGINLAKPVFSIHGVDVNDKCKLRKTIKRNKLLAEVAKLPPCIIAMMQAQVHITGHESSLNSVMTCESWPLSLSFLIDKTRRMTPMMPKLFGKQPQDQRHGLSV